MRGLVGGLGRDEPLPDVDRPDEDADWNFRMRRETPLGRLDRNWADLLQELRVVQTGVQLLTGLLLTVPFQARFSELLPHQRVCVFLALWAVSPTAMRRRAMAQERGDRR